MTMRSSAWRVLVVATVAVALPSCNSDTGPVATSPPPARATAVDAANKAVTDRARAALTEAGAQRLALEPGYDNEVNTALRGVWRGHRLIAYVVPTSELPSSDELTVVARRRIEGQVVEVTTGQHSTTPMLRFTLGSDTWLVASRGVRTGSVALVRPCWTAAPPRRTRPARQSRRPPTRGCP